LRILSHILILLSGKLPDEFNINVTNQNTHLSFGICALFLLNVNCSHQQAAQQTNEPKPLTVIAIGDAGETGSILRGNAKHINDMYCGQHDGGKPDAMIFLGDNFYPTGLNVSVDEVHSLIKKTLGPFREVFEGLGRANVHAIPGNHDYYARNIIDKSLLFGLINIELGPNGISERGNEREKAIEGWTYHYKMPAEVTYPIFAGSKDSAQFIFYDSALPLRTDLSTWKPALDSLRRLLTASSSRNGIVWRVLALHHPWYSVGEHGGYSLWDDEAMKVVYLPNCDKDSNVVHWFINDIDPQDLCAEKYKAMLDSLKSVILASGAKIHLTLAGHEHNLQLLSYPNAENECSNCPKVHVVSGAGGKATIVKLPSLPSEFTSSQPSKKGEPLTGFAQLRFESEKMRIAFFNSANGEMIDMGAGKKVFWINKSGELIQQ
jgi:hypothetical protein